MIRFISLVHFLCHREHRIFQSLLFRDANIPVYSHQIARTAVYLRIARAVVGNETWVVRVCFTDGPAHLFKESRQKHIRGSFINQIPRPDPGRIAEIRDVSLNFGQVRGSRRKHTDTLQAALLVNVSVLAVGHHRSVPTLTGRLGKVFVVINPVPTAIESRRILY